MSQKTKNHGPVGRNQHHQPSPVGSYGAKFIEQPKNQPTIGIWKIGTTSSTGFLGSLISENPMF